MSKILVKRKDYPKDIISDVLYVPSMERNLISLGKLLDKNYIMRLEYKEVKVFHENSKLNAKAPLSTCLTINYINHN